MANALWRVWFYQTWLHSAGLVCAFQSYTQPWKKERGTLGPLCPRGWWQIFHWLKTSLFCPFSIPNWTHFVLFVPRSKAALELYKTWIGDRMENSATVGTSQGHEGKPLVNTRPQALDVLVCSIIWGLPGSSLQDQICCPYEECTSRPQTK